MNQVDTDELINLENRVALAQRLFPSEAQVAMEARRELMETISLEHTRHTGAKRTSSGLKRKHEKIIEEYQTRLKALFKTDMSHLSIPTPEAIIEEYQYQYETRLKEVSNTVELGKRFFPRCSAVLDVIMDCQDLTQLDCVEEDTSEMRQQKKKRYMEIQETVRKAFSEDKEELRNSSLTASPCSSTASCTI